MFGLEPARGLHIGRGVGRSVPIVWMLTCVASRRMSFGNRTAGPFVLAIAIAWLTCARALAQDVPEPTTRVRFTTDGPTELTVFVRSTDHWDRLCLLPCELRVAPGSYAYALSIGDARMPTRPERITVEVDDVQLRAHLDDGSHDRDYGIGLIVGGVVLLGAAIPTLVVSAIGFAEIALIMGCVLAGLGAIVLTIGSVVLGRARTRGRFDVLPDTVAVARF